MNERAPRQEQNHYPNPQESLNTELPIRYTSPAERSLEEMPQHAFELVEDGEVVGGVEIDYFSRPLPLYQLTDLWVDNEYAGQGNASRIMAQVEAFLRERGKPGMLVDAIVEGSPAHV